MSNDVFISYRRLVSEFIARAVFQDLRACGINVFMDVESIDAGEFEQIILNQIAARPYFLLILAPGTLERCDEPADWLRREIEYAMELDRVIVPLMTAHFRFEDARPFLTGKLAELQRYQALSIPHDYFEAAMERLRTRFLKPVEMKLKPTPRAEQALVQRKVDTVASGPTITERHLSAQDHFEQALLQYMREDKAGAIVNYRKALELNPDFAEAYCALGLAYRDTGQPAGAVGSFHAALELQPDHPLAEEMRRYINLHRDRFKIASE